VTCLFELVIKIPTTHIVQGSDPEFSIANAAGECVPADRLLSSHGQLGCDGRSDTGELRPTAGDVPEHLMNIRKLIGEFAERFPDHIMLAGSRHFRQPLGGHIHFSGTPVKRPAKIVQCLDVHLSIPMLMLENRESAKQRRQTDYGQLGSWRNQRDLHGGFEYRTPSSWLVSMNIAKMTLEIAMLIAYDYKHLMDSRNNCFINPLDDIIRLKYCRVEKDVPFNYNGASTTLWDLSLEAVRKLKALPNAFQVMNSILTLENALLMKTRWFHEIDCTTRWHLPSTTLKLKKQKWEFDITSVEVQVFGHPADISCLELANIVKVALENYEIENKYFIYGILNKYGKDFAVSRSFNHYEARVDMYNISERWFGRAQENAPFPDAILIGVSRRHREASKMRDAASSIFRIIRNIEGF